MPRRSAALIGVGEGPLVGVGRVRAELQLRGTQEGDLVEVETFCEKGERLMLHQIVHGEEPVDRYELDECHSLRVRYNGGNRHFIACVLTGV